MNRFDQQVLVANHITLPLRHFWIDGPNGKHLGFVLPLLGEKISRVINESPEKQKRVLLQIATGLKFLHKNGICHGDLTPESLLFRMPNQDHITKDQMKDLLTRPDVIEPDFLYEGTRHMAPKGLSPLQRLPIKPTGDITIIDFDVAFDTSSPPSIAKLPMTYRPPEAMLDMEFGPSLDIWAFACIIMNVTHKRGGVFAGSDAAEAICNLEAALGARPEPYKSAYKKLFPEQTTQLGEYFKSAYMKACPKLFPGEVVEAPADELSSTPEEEEDLSFLTYPPVPEPSEILSLEEAEFFPGESLETSMHFSDVWRMRESSAYCYGHENPLRGLLSTSCVQHIFPQFQPGDRINITSWKTVYVTLSEDEVEILMDLLSKCFRYDASQRLSLEDMMSHQWFDASVGSNRIVANSRLAVKANRAQVRNEESEE